MLNELISEGDVLKRRVASVAAAVQRELLRAEARRLLPQFLQQIF